MQPIRGQRIIEVRDMTEDELRAEGWERALDAPGIAVPPALVLENGLVLYPSMDPEGNGPGALFGVDQEEGGAFYVQEE